MKTVKLLLVLVLMSFAFSCQTEDVSDNNEEISFVKKIGGVDHLFKKVEANQNHLKNNAFNKAAGNQINCQYIDLATGTIYTDYTFNGVHYYQIEWENGNCYLTVAQGSSKDNCESMSYDGLTEI